MSKKSPPEIVVIETQRTFWTYVDNLKAKREAYNTTRESAQQAEHEYNYIKARLLEIATWLDQNGSDDSIGEAQAAIEKIEQPDESE